MGRVEMRVRGVRMAAQQGKETIAPVSSAAKAGLAVLTFINLFNYLDRFIVAALEESLTKGELHLTDLQFGALTTSFLIVYMLTSPIFGTLGDRGARNRLVALGVAIWSVATALAGLARNFTSLFVSRAGVGVGEAAYGTISPAMLADYFPKSQRGRVFAVFFSAIPIGSALGYIVGGTVDRHFGWRAAFFVAGLPGLLLAVFAYFLKDPPRGGQDEPGEGPPPPRAGSLAAYGDLLRNTRYLLTVLGYAAYTFAIGGLAIWMPGFLERTRGVPKQQATVTFGAIVVVTGFVGTFLGGWLGDRLLSRLEQSYLWVSGVATLLAAPVAVVALTALSPGLFWPAMALAEVLLFVSTGPINSAIVNVVAPSERATAVAFSILAIHVLGDVPSPPLIGAISDRLSLDRALLLVPVAITVSGLIWVGAALHKGRRAGISDD
jgi:MFS transporter, Spinster family, sphingosine-1-phosphate transporter